MLYVRMLLAMAVGLYTSRVVLDVLGVEDFGTYHVVAGFVALMGFMQGTMITATQRYFAFDLGQNNGSNLRSLFNTSLQIHALLAVCISLVAETLGYWFVSTQLTIPPDRLDAALTAYHLSVAAFIFHRPFRVVNNWGRGAARFTSLLELMQRSDSLIKSKKVNQEDLCSLRVPSSSNGIKIMSNRSISFCFDALANNAEKKVSV